MDINNFSTVVGDKRYINPQTSLDEQNAFIENLRTTQGQRTGEIAQQTYNLGTDIPSNLGGLGGSGTYFTSRYQTPQTNTLVADLKATAQAQALNDVMNNALAQAKAKYDKAYKNYQKRSGSGGNTGGNLPSSYLKSLPVDVTNKYNASDKLRTRESSSTSAKLQQYKNELGPLKQLYESTEKKYGINGDRGSAWYDYLTTPVTEYGNIAIRDAQAERKKRIDELEQKIKKIESGK